ncbi:MAG: ATP-binding protein [Lachnospiraceae bacterium]|nr:ATP-binding protein [Lachnospiraceae bacterium]
MIHYKKAVYITLFEFVVVLAITAVFAWFYYDGIQFEQVAYVSLFFWVAAFIGSYLLIDSQTKVVTFIFAVIIITTYVISYILQTISTQIIVYLVTACILTIFLNYRYILVYGITTFIMQIFFILFHHNIISEVMHPYLYLIYLICYGIGMCNIYLLVKHASISLARVERAHQLKNNFLAAMAHEIRTPMNAIISLSEKILNDQQPEVIIDHTEKIINAGNILLSMTNGILDFTLIESGKYTINQTAYHLEELINEAVEMTKLQLINKEIAFDKKILNELPAWLYGDQMRIRQILLNILTNAVKYTEKGKITMTVNWEGGKEKGTLIFAVNDTGCGIKKTDLENIFHSFTRLSYSPKVEGTGLGLPICRELAAQMNGEIRVGSTYKVGSTFTIIIPQQVYYKSKLIKAPGAKILIVEDTRVNCLLIERLLEPFEVIVETVKDGFECLAKTKEMKFDLIIMDYLMPEIDGLETVRLVRKQENEASQTVPIVILSSGDEKRLKEEFLSAGCCDYIEKPIETEKLEYIIINYLPKHLLVEDMGA